jgi:hypothetical protein
MNLNNSSNPSLQQSQAQLYQSILEQKKSITAQQSGNNGQKKRDIIWILQQLPSHSIHIPNLQQVIYNIIHNAYIHVTLTQTVYQTALREYTTTSQNFLSQSKHGLVVIAPELGLDASSQMNDKDARIYLGKLLKKSGVNYTRTTNTGVLTEYLDHHTISTISASLTAASSSYTSTNMSINTNFGLGKLIRKKRNDISNLVELFFPTSTTNTAVNSSQTSILASIPQSQAPTTTSTTELSLPGSSNQTFVLYQQRSGVQFLVDLDKRKIVHIISSPPGAASSVTSEGDLDDQSAFAALSHNEDNLSKKQREARELFRFVQDKTRCSVCYQSCLISALDTLNTGAQFASNSMNFDATIGKHDVVVFGCGHTAHKSCTITGNSSAQNDQTQSHCPYCHSMVGGGNQ